MRFECPQCKTAYSISDTRVQGKVLKIRCRNCGQMVEVRDPSSPKLAAQSSPPPIPPRPSSAPPAQHFRWYVGLDGNEEGPLSDEDLAERVRLGRISGNHFVWREGLADWVPILTVPELAGLLSRPPRPSPRPPIQEPATDKAKRPPEKKVDRAEDATQFDPGARGVAPAPAQAKAAEASPADGEDFRLDLLERVHRKRQQVRADRKADRIAEYFFQSTDLLGETPSLPPPPVPGVEQLAQQLDQEAEQERAGEPADPLAAMVRREESLEEISKITRVLADQARVGAAATGRRLGVTLALIFGLVGMLTGFVAMGISQGWFSAIGRNVFGVGKSQESEPTEMADLELSPEESRRLREQLWLEKRKAAGGSVMTPDFPEKMPGEADAQLSEREKELLSFYQQEAERKREVMPRKPESLLGLKAPAELSLPSLSNGTTAYSAGDTKREVVPQAPERMAATGELSEAQIKQVIDGHYPQLKKCLEHQLKRDARVSGKLMVTALVTPKGKVTKAWIPTQKFRGTYVEECLVREVQRWEFPAFLGSQQEVSFPLLLSPQVGN